MAIDDLSPPLESLARTRYNSAQEEFSNTIKSGVKITKLDALARVQFLDMMSADIVASNSAEYGMSEEERRRAHFSNLNEILVHNDAGNVEPPFEGYEITAIKATITALAWTLEGKRTPGLIFPE